MSLDGKIEWLHVLPKEQKEIIQLSNNTTHGTGLSFNMGSSFFGASFNWPFYAGFGVLSNENGIAIIFNDHGKNDKVLQLGQKVKRISYFRKSDCFGVRLDPITGNYKRSLLFSNRDVPTAMPRLGVSMGKEFYLIGKEDRFFGKTKIAVGKVVLKK